MQDTTLKPLSGGEAEASKLAALERGRRRIATEPDPTIRAMRTELLQSNRGYGYLHHKLFKFEHLDRGILSLLEFVGCEEIWQLCARKRSELAALQGATWEGPLFDDDELDQIEQFLAQLDLSLTPG